jgi:gliding motility-associated-like protein
MKHKLLLFFLLITLQLFSQSKNQTIGFKENKGQIINQKGKSNDAVKYLLDSNGLNVQLRRNGFSYDVYEVKKTPSKEPRNEREHSSHFQNNQKEEQPTFNLKYTFHRIDIDFVNSNSKVELITDQKSKDFDNYYNIPNKPEGITGVYQYKQITYKNIYPNIDVVFSIPNDPQKTVEYNFVIHPKAKISDIQLKFNGAETDLIDNKIQMNVRFGKMEETLPTSWIEDGTSKKEISINYTKIKKDVYGFTSSDEVSNKTVIIDPVPTRLWGTYYGGAEFDYATSVFAKEDFVYMAGVTYSANNIASSGAYRTNYTPGGSNDSFFSKLNSDGTRVWGTYYGGSNADNITQIKVSEFNNIYITGSSLSVANISTLGTYQPIKSGYFDGFIAKFDTNGVRQWGTYYGGLDNEDLRSIVIDSNENAYISGETLSTENISTVGAHQPLNGNTTNSKDGFIAKLDKNGSRIWATFYGGSDDDYISDSKLDSHGDIIFLGFTQSNNNISTVNSYQELKLNDDSFLVKFSPDGNRKWGTYLGGNNNDLFYYLGIDAANNLYCFGETNSTSNINTSGVFQENFIPNKLDKCGAIIKLDPNGFKIWGSYFFPEAIGGSVSKNGSIYFTGRAENGFTTTPNTYQENKNAGTDSYLVKFNTNGEREWATYVGGEMADNALLTEVENTSNIYLAGTTQSKTNIATLNTFQPNLYPDTNSYTFNTGDAFLIKFQECLSNPSASSNSPVCIGKTLELKASGGTNYSWTGPNGFTSTDQNPTIINTTTLNSGAYSCVITGTGGCDDTKKVDVIIGDIQAPIPDITTLTTITGDCHTVINTIPTATDVCVGAITGSTTNPLTYSLPGTYTIIWNYDDGNGNISHQNQTVTITSQPIPSANTPQTFCILQNATFNNISITGQNIKWYDAQTAGTILPNTTLLQNGTTYYASQTINGCESERIPVAINIQNTLPPTGNINQTFCSSQNPTIANLEVTGNLIKWYDALSAGSLLPESTNLVDGKIYYTSQTINSCESTRFAITASIVNTPSTPTGNSSQAFCKNDNATLSNIQITGQNIKWYDTNFAAAVLPNNTLLEDNKIYYVSQTTGCESDRIPILVKVNDTPLPMAKTEQLFCIDELAAIADINIQGAAILWFDAPTAGNLLKETTLLQNGTYYATQTLNNCESQRLAVIVKIQDTQIPIADSPQKFCIQKKADIADIAITGQNIKWFNSASSTINLPETTLLENGLTYYASQTINSCESDRIPVTIKILEATTTDCINFVDELPFPKFFTPNNDGHNDTWTIDFAYLAPNTGIRIFDRYGKFIKEFYKNGAWDGTYIGRNEPASDYWFTVTRVNGTEFRGHFSLKR